MPYKFNESRRHKIPKVKYRVTNWPEYDVALVRRGSLTVWMTEEAIAAWQAPATGISGWSTDLLGNCHRDEPRAPPGLLSATATD